MWIVRLALARPYTFVVMAMLIFIVGAMTIIRVPKDIFPDIDIPVISVVWGYGGLTPEEMEQRIVTNYERALTTTVNDIDHIESQSLSGVAVVKIFFQPGARIEHEATTSKIAEDQLFYCLQRGLAQEEAVALIVNGFCKEVLQQLPMEFAVEAQKLVGISLEGSVG